jgi:acyl-CoA thioester hydrolase
MIETNCIYSHKVYLDETDAQGVVYNANYLVWFERGRSEWLSKEGFSHNLLENKLQASLVLYETKVSFLSPARLEDKVIIKTLLDETNLIRFKFRQIAYAQGNESKIYAQCDSIVVGIDILSRKPKKLKINI